MILKSELYAAKMEQRYGAIIKVILFPRLLYCNIREIHDMIRYETVAALILASDVKDLMQSTNSCDICQQSSIKQR